MPKDSTRSNVHATGEPPSVPATDRNRTPIPVTASPPNPYEPMAVGDTYGAWQVIAVYTRKAFPLWEFPSAIFNGIVYQYDVQCACGTIRYKRENPRVAQRCCHCRSVDTFMQCTVCDYAYYTHRPYEIPCGRCHAPASAQDYYKPPVCPPAYNGPLIALTDDEKDIYLIYPDGHTEYFTDESGESA